MAWQAEAGELEGSPHAAVGSTWQAEARGLGLKQKKIKKKIKKGQGREQWKLLSDTLSEPP